MVSAWTDCSRSRREPHVDKELFRHWQSEHPWSWNWTIAHRHPIPMQACRWYRWAIDRLAWERKIQLNRSGMLVSHRQACMSKVECTRRGKGMSKGSMGELERGIWSTLTCSCTFALKRYASICMLDSILWWRNPEIDTRGSIILA